MPKRKQKYFSAAFIFIIGAAVAAGSFEYNIGTLTKMGPGYFPLMLGSLLAILGILIAVTPDSPDEMLSDAQAEPLRTIVRRHLRPWGATLGGVVAFVVLGKYGGLVPATFMLIFISALGDPQNPPKQCALLGVGVTLFAVAAFHYGLQMQFALFTWP